MTANPLPQITKPTNKTLWFFQVAFTIAFAMCLRIAPWADDVALFNPDWILLTLMYWSVVIPERIGIFYAWSVGLLTDQLTSQLFGLHALSYSLIIYACLKLHKRLRQYPLSQQLLFVFFCLLIAQLMFFFLKNLQHPVQLSISFWFPIIAGTVCWFPLFTLLRTIRLPEQSK